MSKLKLEVILAAVDKMTRPLKQAMAGNKELARAVKESRDQLKQLQATQGSIDAFRKLTKESKDTGQALQGAKQRLEDVRRQMEQAGGASLKLSREYAAAERSVDKLTLAHRKRLDAARAAAGALQKEGIDTRQLSAAESALASRIDATNHQLQERQARLDRVARKQRQLSEAHQRYGRQLEMRDKLAGGSAATVATGAAIGAPVFKMVGDYSKFEDAMLGVARQVDGARDDNGKLTATYFQMGDAIKAMSAKIPMATTEIAALVEGGARMGVKGKADLLEFARVAALAATAFDLPADQLSEDMGKIANVYKVPIKNISALGDVINYLDDNAQSKGADIINVMQRIAGNVGSMDYKQAAALGSTFLSLGASAEIAATASKAMVRELQIATKQPKRFQRGLKELGLNGKQIEAQMARDTTGTILKVMEAVNKIPQTRRMGVMVDLFGKEYGDDAAKLADNLGEYRRQLQLVNDVKAKGSMQREGDARNDTLSAQWQMTKNRLFNQSAEMGQALRQPLLDIMKGAADILQSIASWTKANPELAATLVKIAAAVSMLLAVVGTLGLTIAAVLGPMAIVRLSLGVLSATAGGGVGILSRLGGALGMVGKVFMWVGRIFLLNPIGLVVTAIAAAAYLIWKNWDWIGPKFAALWEGIKSVFSTVCGWIVDYLMNWTPVGFVVRHWEDICKITAALWGKLKGIIAAAGGAIADWFLNWTPAGRVIKHWDLIKAATQVAWDWISAKATGAGQVIADWFLNWTLPGLVIKHWDTITGFLGGLGARLAELGRMAMDGLINGVMSRLTALRDALSGIGDTMIAALKTALDIHSPSRVMAQLGGYTMAGLEQGLDKGQAGPLSSMRNTAKGLIAAGAGVALTAGPAMAGRLDTRPPLSASAPAAVVPPVINIAVHAAPGMDERQLAALVRRQVEQALAQAASKQAAARRSRLGDFD
ncbi:phage tail tape measure protein [Chromobacterium violaceum]|uniref:phage tail tape measure protein n=1 Tax=Chromobacterium violaceum TaxID=536 RepID=UPI00143D248B|nr:phage tail tape measure protein [Chromobacterium violaceum]QIY78353.1 phage tail tape measure protein [Chromobacterium violaceum]